MTPRLLYFVTCWSCKYRLGCRDDMEQLGAGGDNPAAIPPPYPTACRSPSLPSPACCRQCSDRTPAPSQTAEDKGILGAHTSPCCTPQIAVTPGCSLSITCPMILPWILWWRLPCSLGLPGPRIITAAPTNTTGLGAAVCGETAMFYFSKR